MDALQSNTKNKLINTLQIFASFDEQKQYKNAVPFVHVPLEIIAQWDSYRILRKKEWYTEIWNSEEMKNIDDFDFILQERLNSMGDLMDVPDILEDKKWIEIREAAYYYLGLMMD